MILIEKNKTRYIKIANVYLIESGSAARKDGSTPSGRRGAPAPVPSAACAPLGPACWSSPLACAASCPDWVSAASADEGVALAAAATIDDITTEKEGVACEGVVVSDDVLSAVGIKYINSNYIEK